MTRLSISEAEHTAYFSTLNEDKAINYLMKNGWSDYKLRGQGVSGRKGWVPPLDVTCSNDVTEQVSCCIASLYLYHGYGGIIAEETFWNNSILKKN